ncbi:unnamed protein product [Meloidogyne enterolobii]|uniref:Uncharacterized protein n=1 Tax=Meloidogyne enterolobii TaxID=390850 RepID=A0ACB0YW55_MELEN
MFFLWWPLENMLLVPMIFVVAGLVALVDWWLAMVAWWCFGGLLWWHGGALVACYGGMVVLWWLASCSWWLNMVLPGSTPGSVRALLWWLLYMLFLVFYTARLVNLQIF